MDFGRIAMRRLSSTALVLFCTPKPRFLDRFEMMKRLSATLLAYLVLFSVISGCNSEPDNAFAIKVTPNAQTPPPEPETNEGEMPDPNNPFTPTSTSMQGLWKMKTGLINGTGFPASMVNSTTLRIDGENYEVDAGGNPDKGTVSVDMASSPYKMTIKSVEGANAGKTMLAIFEMPNANTLRICYDATGTDFPKDYESTSENGFFSAVYKLQP